MIGQIVINGVGPLKAPFRKIDFEDTFQLVKWNGTTYFNKVSAGTIMGQVTASKKVRPCAKTYAQAASGVAIYPVDDADNFYIGDTIDVISTLGVKGSVTIVADGGGNRIDLESISADGLAHRIVLSSPTLGVFGTVTINADGAGNEIDFASKVADGLAHAIVLTAPTLGVLGAVTINADGAGNEIDLVSQVADGLAHTITLVNPAGASDLQGASTINAATGIEAVVITLAHSGAALTSTINQVIAEINATSQKMFAYLHAGDNGAATAAAVGATPLAGGVAAPQDKQCRGSSSLAAATDLETVTITLGMNAAGTALTSTINEVIGVFNANSQKMEARLHAGDNGAATAIGVASTPLAGGVAAPADKTLRGQSSLAAATDLETLTIVLGLNEAGTALASTVSEVIACINAESQKMEARLHTGDVGSSAAIAVGSTPLAGACAIGGKLLTGATVTGVDKTASPNTITTASTITTVNDDVVQVNDGSATAIGVLRDDTNTFTGDVDENGAVYHADTNCRLVRAGVIDASACVGYAAALQGADLTHCIFE